MNDGYKMRVKYTIARTLLIVAQRYDLLPRSCEDTGDYVERG
jgi:hypothetical protein